MVDLPDSPDPNRTISHDARHREPDIPNRRSLHSFLNFFESSSNCLSITLLLSFVFAFSGPSASAWSSAKAELGDVGSEVRFGCVVGVGAGAVVVGAEEMGCLVSVVDVEGLASAEGDDMQPPMVITVSWDQGSRKGGMSQQRRRSPAWQTVRVVGFNGGEQGGVVGLIS